MCVCVCVCVCVCCPFSLLFFNLLREMSFAGFLMNNKNMNEIIASVGIRNCLQQQRSLQNAKEYCVKAEARKQIFQVNCVELT